MPKKHLPVVSQGTGAIRSDGSRKKMHPADVRGRFVRWRRVVFYLLILTWLALPLVEVSGRPAVFLDIEHRSFFLFGATFNSQDIWMLFFLITGVVFGLAYLTALLGRVWCGWACPQTVFLEAVYRPIERLIEGPGEKRARLPGSPWSGGRIVRLALKHALFIVASLLVSHIFVGYFVSLPSLLAMMQGSPSDHPEAFAWMAAVTFFFYGNFAWFREQLCVIVCPYGRLQSVLVDDDSLVIGYDEARGEPRGKVKDDNRGDCIDCNRCVAVCPTGIDIRKGLQLDCVACAQCVDACDEIMAKVKQKPGLVRYDSMNGLAGRARRIVRPRIYVYTALMALGLLVFGLTLRGHEDFEAVILRRKGMPFVVEDGLIRNSFEIQLVNKRSSPEVFEIRAPDGQRVQVVVPTPEVPLDPRANVKVPVMVTRPEGEHDGDVRFRLVVSRRGNEGHEVEVDSKFVGPGG